MPQADTLRRERLLLGILLVVASTVFLSAGDTAAKYLSASLPALQIAWLRYLGFLLILLPVSVARGAKRMRPARPGWQVLRGLALVGSTFFFFSALRYLGVPEVTAIFFIAPILVTALSGPLLRERVGAGRWLAAAVGFLGVLIVIRPGTEAFRPAALLPAVGALCWACALLVTRRLSRDDPPLTTLTWSAVVGFALLSCAVPFLWTPLGWPELALGALVGIASTVGHWLVVMAYRHGDASILSPYGYSQLIWASALSWLAFGAIPDLWTYAGAAVIVAGGLFTAYAERREHRRKAQGPGDPAQA